jgi:anti-sigma regulatory factor (Ser/Thr protein kinase)
MSPQEHKILKLLEIKKQIKTQDLVSLLKVSRQYAKVLINNLITSGKLMKIGSTRSAFYVSPQYAAEHLEMLPTRIRKSVRNVNLEEHKILDDVEDRLPLVLKLRENVRSILTYAFSEMLNNAIEHSGSKNIQIEVDIANKKLSFRIIDSGIGVFRNVMRERGLKSELEAVQDLLKGKTTTQPKLHSGEGIFFTSKVADIFILDSFGLQLIVNNRIGDVFVAKNKKTKHGTTVSFEINIDSDRHLNDIFRKYTDVDEGGDYGFDKTEIKVKLYTSGGIHVSRSQARRVLTGLDQFKSIVFDFDKVPMVGQAFADEIFRVFHNRYPEIKLQATNMNEAVKFMVDRVEGHNPRKTPTLFGE